MKKHLDVLLALVALVGLVNGLAGGAGGGVGGGAAAGSTGKTSNGGRGSGLPGSASSSGTSNSTLGLVRGAGGRSVGGASEGGGPGGSPSESVDAKSAGKPSNGGNSTLLPGGPSRSGPSNFSSGPSVGDGGGRRGTSDAAAGGTSGSPSGSSRGPGSNPSTSGTSRGDSDFREGCNSGPGAPSSAGNRNGGESYLLGRTPGSGPFGRGSGLDVGSRGPGLGSSSVGSGRRAGASGGGGGRLDGELLAGGLGFPSALGGNSDYYGDEERDFPASGSLSGSSGFGGEGRNGGFSAGPPGFGALGSPVTVGGRDGASDRGRGPLGGDQLSDEGLEFGRAFGRSDDSYTRPGNRFPGNSFSRWSSGLGEQGLYGDFGAGSSGENFNGGTGGIGEGTPGFGAFGSGSGTDFSSRPSGFRFPAGLDGRTGSNGISSGGGDEVLPGSYPAQGAGAFSDADTGPSGSPGWRTRDIFNDFGSSDLDSSPGLSSRVAPSSGGSEPSRSWPRLWRGGRGGHGQLSLRDRLRKPDPRLAAAVALRTLAGAAAIGRLGVRLAAAIHGNRRNEQGGFGGHSRGCVGHECARQRRLYRGLKVADEILTRLPLNLARLY